MRTFILILLLFPLIGFGQVPDLDWVKTFVTPNDSRPLSIKTDNNGFLYVGGFYTGTSDFDPGPGVFNLTSQSTPGQNGFIAKYTSSGAFVWAKSFDCDNTSHVTSIDIDSNSDIVIIGSFGGNIDLDPNSGTANYSNSYYRDLFVVKLDSSSNHLWSFTALSTSSLGSVYGSKIKIDISNNIIITGPFRGATDFDPSSNQSFVYPDFTSDQFIAKYSPQGLFLWATNIGISADATAVGVSGYNLDIDDNNNIFTTGWFYSTTSLPSGPNYTVANVPVTPNKNNVLTKYDSLGNFLWAQHIISNAACGLKIDNSNNILVQYTGTNMFGNYTNAIIHKKNNDGVSIWNKSYGISLDVHNRFSMDVDIENNIYTTNRYYPYVTHPDFDADPSSTNSYILPDLSSGSYDVFVQCLDSTGSFKWAGNMGSSFSQEFVSSIEVDNNGSVYLSGNYGGTWDFDMSSNTFTQTANGGLDMWLLKLVGNCISTSYTDTQTACESYTWIDGNNYTASNNTATYTTINAAGCDSVITIDLTIDPLPSNAVIQNGATLTATQTGATYQWIDCDDEQCSNSR